MVAVSAACCAVVVRAGTLVVRSARAQSAADSVALAFVTRSPAVASDVARRTGARIVTVDDDGTTVAVTVESGGLVRSATAARSLRFGP